MRSLLFLLSTISMSSLKYITKNTKIINIGHLPGHVNRKVELLKEAGFINSCGIITLETTKEAIKEDLKNSPNSLFIIGGAMIKTYPELVAELNEYITNEVPSIIIHTTTAADFPPGIPLPPSEEVVAQSGVTVALRYLAKEEL